MHDSIKIIPLHYELSRKIFLGNFNDVDFNDAVSNMLKFINNPKSLLQDAYYRIRYS